MTVRQRRAERAALLSLLVTVALVILKFAVWAATSSLAVLSQALDSVLDLIALGVVFLGVRVAGKPADESHHYGHGKAENIAAFGQTILIGVVVLVVAFEALRRLTGDGPQVEAPWYAIALLVLSVVVDALRVSYLTIVARSVNSDALRAGALNIAGDLGTALVAVASLIFVRTGIENADPVGALIVVVLVAVVTVRLGKRSVDVLMDKAPSQQAQTIQQAAAGAPGVQAARRVRLRGSPESLFADVTVTAGRTASLERAHDIAEGVEREVRRAVPGVDVVVHIEPAPETGGLVERVQAAAGRSGEVQEVHNVLVHAFDEGGREKLHVTLHAKVRRSLSVKEAHDLSDRIEAAVAQELGRAVRVDTHIEPLEPTVFGRDVTSDRPDVAATLLRLAEAEPDVLDCHDIVITDAAGSLSVTAHATGRAQLALSKIHDAATRIESALHVEHPEVRSVLIHFEPGERS